MDPSKATIYKYPLGASVAPAGALFFEERAKVLLGSEHKVLSVGVQDKRAFLWAAVVPGTEVDAIEEIFWLVPTGGLLPNGGRIGALVGRLDFVVDGASAYVLHVFAEDSNERYRRRAGYSR